MVVYPNAAPRTLSDSHRRMLFSESGIDPGVAEERGTFTATRGKDVPQGQGKLPAKPGLVFPVHTLDGGIFHRLRPDNPGRSGAAKYMQPKGAPNRLDVHPRQHAAVKGTGGMRYLTEGEKKVDAGVSRGLLMVGVSGVFNGQRDKGAALIDDWRLLPREGENYSITFDSDIETNQYVQLAADRYARLLRAAGANAFITLLPPAPDGGKQGLDDFFVNGGTVKQLELLTRPYDEAVVERVRLTRDDKLRAAFEDLERRWWDEEWKGVGGHSARDVALKLIEAARRHGKIHADGIRVRKAQGPLAVEARVSSRTLWKSLGRLEEMGFGYRDNEGRKADKSGAFVLRANVSHKGESNAGEGQATKPLQACNPGDLHLRAKLRSPRLMWSRPKFTPKRGTVAGTRRVRESKPLEPRDRIERLGKIRGAILDALDAAGGTATLREIADALHRKRTRDIRRRNLPWLEEAGIINVEGDAVTLADNWLDRLEEAREAGGELEAEELARRRYRDKSRAYHRRHEAPKSKPTAAGLAAVERSRKKRAEHIEAHDEHQAAARVAELAAKKFAKRYVHDRLRVLGRIRLELLQQILRDAGGNPSYALPAAQSLGCTVRRLPEYENREFVFAPREWAESTVVKAGRGAA